MVRTPHRAVWAEGVSSPRQKGQVTPALPPRRRTQNLGYCPIVNFVATDAPLTAIQLARVIQLERALQALAKLDPDSKERHPRQHY